MYGDAFVERLNQTDSQQISDMAFHSYEIEDMLYLHLPGEWKRFITGHVGRISTLRRSHQSLRAALDEG